jgi:Fe-S cluster assembly protein SufD
MPKHFFPESVKRFHDLLETRKSVPSLGTNIDALKKVAWDYFSSTGIPLHRRGNELWKYTNLRPITDSSFTLSSDSDVNVEDIVNEIPWSNDWHNILFINGVYRPDSLGKLDLPSGLSISDFEHKNMWTNFGSLAKPNSGTFAALNTVFVQDGISIKIEPNTKIRKPINVIFVVSEVPRNFATFPRVYLDVGENSEATMIESYISLTPHPVLTIPVVEIEQHPEAVLRHYRIQMENENSFHIGSTRVVQKRNSKFESSTFATGPRIGRNDIHVSLNEPYAMCQLHGLYITFGDQQQDNEISTTHSKPSCTSGQFYKGILAGKSTAVFSGGIVVEKGAQKSIADQKDLNLLLSKGVEIDTKPSLEIFADDVQCSHGATAGHIDLNSLFYLQSRGLDFNTAKAMLIRGFADEMIVEFEPTELFEFISGLVDDIIPTLQSQSDTIGTT